MSGCSSIFDLTGRRILVTGASRGIGFAFAQGFAAYGAEVVLVARGSLQGAVDKLRASGAKAEGICADLGQGPGRDKLWLELEERGLLPDVLVNNAGIIRRAEFADFSFSDWQEVIDVNLTAAFDLSQKFAQERQASERPGKIINVLSLLSYQGGIRVASYTAAKSGLLGLTRLMANDLAAHKINVNGIVPGYIATENTRPLREDAERNQAILSRIPAGRWGEPEDLQGAAIFLASHASDYVYGEALTVDGGWMVR